MGRVLVDVADCLAEILYLCNTSPGDRLAFSVGFGVGICPYTGTGCCYSAEGMSCLRGDFLRLSSF